MRSLQYLFLFLCLLLPTSLMGQTDEWRLMREGNRAFRNNDFKTAEQRYRQALEQQPNSARAAFNLGDAYLAQKNAKGALQQYERAAKGEKNKTIRAMAHHNIGYVHHVAKAYDKAIEAYKEALRLNPRDEDTRYNLVLAQKQRKQQNNQQNQKQEKDQKQDKSSQPSSPKDTPQQQPSQMSKDNVEQLLHLSRQAEQQTRQKVQQAGQPQPRQLDKNW